MRAVAWLMCCVSAMVGSVAYTVLHFSVALSVTALIVSTLAGCVLWKKGIAPYRVYFGADPQEPVLDKKTVDKTFFSIMNTAFPEGASLPEEFAPKRRTPGSM